MPNETYYLSRVDQNNNLDYDFGLMNMIDL